MALDSLLHQLLNATWALCLQGERRCWPGTLWGHCAEVSDPSTDTAPQAQLSPKKFSPDLEKN